MANHIAIHSFCQSLRDYLTQRHAVYEPPDGVPELPAASFNVLSSSTFSSTAAIEDSTGNSANVTLYLHRVTINNHLRNLRSGSAVGPLGLDLHLLLTVWADKAEEEHTLLAWTMRELHQHAFMDRSSLNDDAGWAPDEQINIVPADLSPEEMARIWEAAHRGYRLSYPFIARVIRIGVDPVPDGAPVVATRFSYTDNLQEKTP